VSTFIERYSTSGAGIRVAVKDLIDLTGCPTSAGCKAQAERAEAASVDATCMAGARAVGARIVGKANLSELAYDTIGDNVWYGTPVNPLDPTRIPGGSSSGSAVAVATDEADVAYGSDTGGSIRVPSACCGTVGLKTTHGRVPLGGVWPLSQSLDTVGPMAADVAKVALGMALLEPGFLPATAPASTIGRLRIPGADPKIDSAIDRILAAAELKVVEVCLEGWSRSESAFESLISGEAWTNNGYLLADRGGISDEIADRIARGAGVTKEMVVHARRLQQSWRDEVEAVFDRVQLLALPTLLGFAPGVSHIDRFSLTALTSPFNVSGSPALSLPIRVPGEALPASLQLVGPQRGEELLCATAAVVEAVARS
jgi:amidase